MYYVSGHCAAFVWNKGANGINATLENMKVLVIDDDQDICGFLKAHLPARGFEVEVGYEGQTAIAALHLSEYDLLVLDLNLPDMAGEEVIHSLRQRGQKLPVLVFSVVANVDSKVRLLNSGADDYLVKPFSFEELVARMRALTRRPPTALSDILMAADLEMDVGKQSVRRGDQTIALTRKEFAILECLLRHQGEVVSKSMLIDRVWDSAANPFSDAIDTHLTNLRKKLGEPELIHTVHGRGYRIG